MLKQFDKVNDGHEKEIGEIKPTKVNVPKPIELTKEQDDSDVKECAIEIQEKKKDEFGVKINTLEAGLGILSEKTKQKIRENMVDPYIETNNEDNKNFNESKMSFPKSEDVKQENIESETMREQPCADLLDIYESRENKNIPKLLKDLTQTESELSIIENEIGKEVMKNNLDWILDNNNRIDLYQITAILNKEPYERADEEMNENKAKQLMAYRKIQAILLTSGEIETRESVELLSNFIERNSSVPYLYNTAIDSLSKNSADNAKTELLKLVDNDNYDYELKTRAILAGLRMGMEFDSQEVIELINEYIESLGDNLCQTTGTYNIIEIAGLLGNRDSGVALLDGLYEKMRSFPDKEKQWFERDIISTRLTIKSEDKEKYLKDNLPDSHYVSEIGIVFGSINSDLDFNKFLSDHKGKFDRIAKTIAKINDAFNSEPIMYVDFSLGDANEAGWTQNSIYFSSEYIEHSDDIDDLLQSTGHEACERWQSKGFIDVDLAKFYIKLMGDNYLGSELDKFRLKHRENGETNSGHPWDGEREFLAELGSTLLVNPECIGELFDSENDKISLEALSYLRKKLNKFED